MNKFLKGILEWKTYVCMMFTGSVIIFWLAAYFQGWEGIPLASLAQLFLLSVIGSLLQGIMFTEWVFKTMAYLARLLGFAVISGGIVRVCVERTVVSCRGIRKLVSIRGYFSGYICYYDGRI